MGDSPVNQVKKRGGKGRSERNRVKTKGKLKKRGGVQPRVETDQRIIRKRTAEKQGNILEEREKISQGGGKKPLGKKRLEPMARNNGGLLRRDKVKEGRKGKMGEGGENGV